MNKSAAFIKELSYCYLAKALFDVSEKIEKEKDGYGEVELRKLDYHTSKKLDRRIKTLKDELFAFIQKNIHLHKKSEAKRERLVRSTIKRAENATIQLDLLACYILYLRFQPHERNTKLYDEFRWITQKESQLMAIIDLLSATNKDEEMYRLACDVVTIL